MPRFRNVSPYGALDLPLIGRTVEAGETFEVTPEQARHLKGQDDNFAPVKDAPKKPAKKAAPKAEPSADEGAH